MTYCLFVGLNNRANFDVVYLVCVYKRCYPCLEEYSPKHFYLRLGATRFEWKMTCLKQPTWASQLNGVKSYTFF